MPEPVKSQPEKIRDHFLAGTLTYAIYSRLSKTLREAYKTLHGYRPMAPHEVVGKRRKEASRTKKRKAAKAARKVNRG